MQLSSKQKERVVTYNSLKILFTGCEVTKNPLLTATIQGEFGLDVAKPPFNYPYDKYLNLVKLVREHLFPIDTEDKGYKKLVVV